MSLDGRALGLADAVDAARTRMQERAMVVALGADAGGVPPRDLARFREAKVEYERVYAEWDRQVEA